MVTLEELQTSTAYVGESYVWTTMSQSFYSLQNGKDKSHILKQNHKKSSLQFATNHAVDTTNTWKKVLWPAWTKLCFCLHTKLWVWWELKLQIIINTSSPLRIMGRRKSWNMVRGFGKIDGAKYRATLVERLLEPWHWSGKPHPEVRWNSFRLKHIYVLKWPS